MSECAVCNEPIDVNDEYALRTIYNMKGPQPAHRVCLLREVVGGIGHLIAHEYWCQMKHDPDAGLTRYQSARLVDAYCTVMGVQRAAEAAQP